MLLLGVLATGAAAYVVASHPGLRARVGQRLGPQLRPVVARVRAWMPGGGDGDAPSSVAGADRLAPPARLTCTPAVPAGTAADPHDLARLGAAERATVLWQWADTVRQAGAQRRALQAAAAARGVAVQTVGRRGAVAATATGDALRALGARAPGASAFTAVPDSRSICVLD